MHLPAALCLIWLAGQTGSVPRGLQRFIYTSEGDFIAALPLLRRSDIAGAQVVYNWKLLEPEKGRYNFSAIDRDLAVTRSLNKKLFIQIQDRFFSPEAKYIPAYLLTDPQYGGGLVAQIDNPGEGRRPVAGWVTEQWNGPVRLRYQELIRALAQRFDGEVYGVNLPETAIDIDIGHDATGFTCDGYFQAEQQNLAFARKVFRRSSVVQYVNFWPCEWNNDHRYMSRLFEFAAANGVGLGGPDIVPFRKAQMSNSYPFFARYRGRLPITAMAVQEPTLTYKNPKTDHRFTKAEFESFAVDCLGANIIFWSTSSPWLKATYHRK